MYKHILDKYKTFIGPNPLLDTIKPSKHSISNPHDSYTYSFTHSPPYITVPLRDYQIDGLNWLISLHNLNINRVLADEMGLGKTIQTIAFLGFLKELVHIKKPHLLIVPKSTLNNWKNEFSKFYPSFKIIIFHCSRADLKNYKFKKNFDAIITTYEMCINSKLLNKLNFSYVIIDEAHRIKNENSKLSKLVRFYKTDHRLLITGTPLQNNVRELWALLNFLVPEIFYDGDTFENYVLGQDDQNKVSEVVESHKEAQENDIKHDVVPVKRRKLILDNDSSDDDTNFIQKDKDAGMNQSESENDILLNSKSNQQSKEINNITVESNNNEMNNTDGLISTEKMKSLDGMENNNGVDQNIVHLRQLILPFFLRRSKKDVESSLLPKKIINLYPQLTQMQRDWYRSILQKDLRSDMLKDKSALMNIVCQLRKVCNHPYLFDGAEPEPFTTDEHIIYNSGKMLIVDKLITKFSDSKILIFSQMTRMLDILEDYLIFRNILFRRLDGQTNIEDRTKGIDEFNNDENIKIYLLTTRAGGLGINLTAASIVIIYDSDWNPQVDLQAMDRAHRIGQKKEVQVFRLISENTIEERILERCMQKLKLDECLLKDKIQKNDLLNIISTGLEVPNTNVVDDIEEILNQGRIKTESLNERINGIDIKKNLDLDMYNWEGEDYKTRVKRLEEYCCINERRNKKKFDFQFGQFEMDRREFGNFLRSCENVGLDFDLIKVYYKENFDENFDEETLRRYFNVFLKRRYELKDIERSLNLIEKAETKRQKDINVKEILRKKFGIDLFGNIFVNETNNNELNNGQEKNVNIKNSNKNEQTKLDDNSLYEIKGADSDDIKVIHVNNINRDENKITCAENLSKYTKNKKINSEIMSFLNDENMVFNKFKDLKISYSQSSRSKYYTEIIDKTILFLYFLFIHEKECIKLVRKNIVNLEWLRSDYFVRTRDEESLTKRIKTLCDILVKQENK